MKESTEDRQPALYLYTPDVDFVRPYFERLMPDLRITESPEAAETAVMLSTVDVYDVSAGTNFNELTPLKRDCGHVSDENGFIGQCKECGLKPTILRCAPIVGTSMAGMPRELAEKIYRGTFIGISGNEARRSVVHAVSLPDAARAVMATGGIFNVTDTVDPSFNDLAEALAWRIAQKRIFYMKPKWFSLLFGKKRLINESVTLTFSCEKLRSFSGFDPVSTVDYLKTHVYDQASL